MKGPLPWISVCEASSVIGDCVDKLIDTAGQTDVTTMSPLQLVSFHIKCHICGHSIEARNKNLIKNGQWGSIFCCTCRVGRKASKWLCTCGVPWYTCAEHRIQGMACKLVQHKRKALQTVVSRSKIRKIPFGVPDMLHKKVRRGSQIDPRSDCSLTAHLGREKVSVQYGHG